MSSKPYRFVGGPCDGQTRDEKPAMTGMRLVVGVRTLTQIVDHCYELRRDAAGRDEYQYVGIEAPLCEL